MAKEQITELEDKPIDELTLDEALLRASVISKQKAKVLSLDEQLEQLARRISELYAPVEEMSLEQLKEEVMKMDAFKCDVIKPFYKREKEVLDYLYVLTGEGFDWSNEELDPNDGFHWQDSRGIVWATEKRTGTFVEFRDFGVTRTRDLERGEKQGLSMTKARQLGYVVEGK